MMLLGAGFGLGVALTLSRLVSGLASRLSPGWPDCVAGPLRARRSGWRSRSGDPHPRPAARPGVAGPLGRRCDVVAAVRGGGIGRHPRAGRRVAAEHRADGPGRGRERAGGRSGQRHRQRTARARHRRRRGPRRCGTGRCPTLQAALDAVRAELGEPGTPRPESPASERRKSRRKSRMRTWVTGDRQTGFKERKWRKSRDTRRGF